MPVVLPLHGKVLRLRGLDYPWSSRGSTCRRSGSPRWKNAECWWKEVRGRRQVLLGETSCAEDHKGSREVAGWTLPRIQGTKKGPGKFGSDSSSLLQIPWFVFTAHLPFPLPFRGHRTHDSGVCIRGLSSSHSHACQLLLTTTAHSFYEHRDLVLLSSDPGEPLLCPDQSWTCLVSSRQPAFLSC